MKEVIDIIKYARKKKNMTQLDLSKKVGCSCGLIKMYESNKRNPSNAKLKTICETLDLDYNYIKMLIVCDKNNVKVEDIAKTTIVYDFERSKKVDILLQKIENMIEIWNKQLETLTDIKSCLNEIQNNTNKENMFDKKEEK